MTHDSLVAKFLVPWPTKVSLSVMVDLRIRFKVTHLAAKIASFCVASCRISIIGVNLCGSTPQSTDVLSSAGLYDIFLGF